MDLFFRIEDEIHGNLFTHLASVFRIDNFAAYMRPFTYHECRHATMLEF